jgi:membrane-associated protease RseP (regulator of RpoE activity)
MNRIHSLPTIAKHGSIAAAMFVFVLALSGVASAAPMSSAHSHKAKKGHLAITAPIEVGGTILNPGEYEVREVNSPNGPVVEFVHQFRNELASELVQADEEEIVARVPFTEQALSSPPKHTQLMVAPNTTNVIALKIRGNPVDHVFQQDRVDQNYAGK